jgi:hypothetical protein
MDVEYESSCHDLMNNLISGKANAEECDSSTIKYELFLLKM